MRRVVFMARPLRVFTGTGNKANVHSTESIVYGSLTCDATAVARTTVLDTQTQQILLTFFICPESM